MLVQKTKRTGRRLKAALLVALAGGSMSLLGSSAALAAVLSFGTFPGGVFGGQNCADVQAASLAASTPVNAFNCTAGPNQQFEFSGKTIYALGGQTCLDVASPDSMPTAGTLVDSYPCNGGPNQQWTYNAGEIINASGLCLDATTGGNGTQLIVNNCTGTASQQWQIK